MLWLVLGLLIGAGFVLLARQKHIRLAWYDWALLALAAVGALMAVQNYQASLAEHEPTAAVILLSAFGVPALLLAAVVAMRVWRSRETVAAPSLSAKEQGAIAKASR